MKQAVSIIALLITLVGCSEDNRAYYRARAEESKTKTNAQADSFRVQASAQAQVSVPVLSYFQERQTIARWARHWDRPSAACYVYLIHYGQIIGYYVSDGKPASTQSYITPTEHPVFPGTSTWVTISAPDIDGCYGSNNPGIRFFTASGIAVEWGGDGASYLYSDAPLKINAPLLGE